MKSFSAVLLALSLVACVVHNGEPDPVGEHNATIGAIDTDLGGCSNGGCAQTCPAGKTCEATCSGGGCAQICSAGASCQFTCSGGGCGQTCAAGATCNFTCSGNGCR